MVLSIARRYAGAIRPLSFGKRIPLVAFGSNQGVAAGYTRSAPILPIRLKNGFATATDAKPKRVGPDGKPRRGRPPMKVTKTEAMKEKAEAKKRALGIEELKRVALKPPKRLPVAALMVFSLEKGLRPGEEQRSAFAALTEHEKSQYREKASANKETNRADYASWVYSYTPLEIKNANQARMKLRNMGYGTRRYDKIKDDRQVKIPLTAYRFLMKERLASGEVAGLAPPQMGVRLGEIWRAMSETQKDKYRKMYERDRQRFVEEYTQLYGKEPAPPKGERKNRRSDSDK